MIRFKKDDGSNYSEWEKKKLKEITEKICVGFVGTCEEFYTDNNGIPMYRTGNLKDGKVILDDMKYVTREFHEKNKKSQLKNRDLLIARHGSNGQASMYKSNNEANCLNIVIVRPDNTKLNDEFLLQYINSQPIKRQVSILTAGSTQSVINTKEIENLIIRFPSNNKEQQKIADFLSSVDDVIAASEQEVAALEEQKKGAMQKIFSQEVRFKADDGSDYPEWEEKKLGELLQYEQPTKYLVKNDDYDGKTKFPVLTANKGFILGYTDETEGVYNKGKVIIFDDFTCDSKFVNFEFKVKSSAIKFLTATNVDMPLEFLYALINNINQQPLGHQRHWISIMQPKEIFVPCLEEQKKIANFLSDFDKAIDLAKQELEQWKELKKGLLQQLFE